MMPSATTAGHITVETPVPLGPSAAPHPIAPSLAAVLLPAPEFVLLAKVAWVAMEPGGALAAAQRF